MSEAFDIIRRGLEAALAFAKGDSAGALIHEVAVPDPDVPATHARMGLSQADFPRSIGAAKATLLNWEQGRRRPEGPARVLLALIAKEPGIVQRMLG